MALFSLVRRWGRDVYYILGVLGSLTKRYDLIISCHGGGPGQTVLITEPQRFYGRLFVVKITEASLTNQGVTPPVMCTVPDPRPTTERTPAPPSSIAQPW